MNMFRPNKRGISFNRIIKKFLAFIGENHAFTSFSRAFIHLANYEVLIIVSCKRIGNQWQFSALDCRNN